MIEIERINLARIASQNFAFQAKQFDEPALVRQLSSGIQIKVPKLDIKAPEVEPLVMIRTDNDANAHGDDPIIPTCTKELSCGHQCFGVEDERKCLPCLDPACAPKHFKGGINADELCHICYTSELGVEACSKLSCGHVFHTNCLVNLLRAKWPKLRITWDFMSCPECRQEISPRGLSKPIVAELGQLLSLKAKVEELALKNAERQGILNDAAVAEKDGKFYGKNQKYANKKCSVFLCNECKKPYFGGLRDCEQDMANEEQNNTQKEDLLCQDCLIKTLGYGETNCETHGAEHIDWKCQFCCAVAVWKCFGTHFFCNPCHDEYNRTMRPPTKDCGGINCPLGIAHPPPNADPRKGGVYPLGCGICRSEKLEKLKNSEIKQVVYEENLPKAYLYQN